MREPLSIWFFAGLLFLIYGVLITGTGLWELAHPLVNPPVLYSQLHPPIWWGGLMTVAGLIYTIRFRPRSR